MEGGGARLPPSLHAGRTTHPVKTVVLAGGSGARLAEETHSKPKALVEIGGRPILWHILRYCSHYGLRDFLIALGYKGDMIKRYLADLCLLGRDLQVDFANRTVCPSTPEPIDWQVELVQTGMRTQTGGRIKRLASRLHEGPFLLLWTDGVFDIDLSALIAFHRSHGKLASMVVVRPPSRFGYAELSGDQVLSYEEKPIRNNEWISAGIFVLDPDVLAYIDGDDTEWERGPLPRLAADGQLSAYRHTSFWQCMDTTHDRRKLEDLWQSGRAPWRVWS